jgi:hypothetical protein
MKGSQRTRVSRVIEVEPKNTARVSCPMKCPVAKHQSRLKRLEADACVQRWEKLLPIILVFLLVICALAVYLIVMLSGGYNADDKERAEKILTPVIACLLGYVGGSSRAKHS